MRRLNTTEIHYYDLVPPFVALTARFVHIPFLWADGVTLGRYVFLRDGFDETSSHIIAHELVHVRQYRNQGVTRFLAAYFAQYAQFRFAGYPHRLAYLHLDAEHSARELVNKWIARNEAAK